MWNALCFGSYIIIDEDGRETGYNLALRRVTFGMMKRDNKIGCGVAYGIQRPVAYYRRRAGSVSSHKLRLLSYNARVYRVVLGYGWLRAYAYLLFCFLPTYAVKVLRRRAASRRWNDSHRGAEGERLLAS